MRQKIIAGNWKMHKTPRESVAFLQSLGDLEDRGDRVILCCPYLSLESMRANTQHPVEIAAQNMHWADEGAFTGEISADMLRSIGIHLTLIGHSERRHDFLEDEELIQKKVKQAMTKNMEVILCVGELLEEREAGQAEDVVKRQLLSALGDLNAHQMKKVIVAYEPVWAIGTGKTASAADAQNMSAFLRQVLQEHFGEDVAEATALLYGGSVKPENIYELMQQEDIDGVLVGGASLKPESFRKLVDFRSQS